MLLVGREDWVGGVEDVEGGRAVVGVDDNLDAVADVVDGPVAERRSGWSRGRYRRW